MEGKSKVIAKIFVGYTVTAALNMHLKKSASWKEVGRSDNLLEVHYQQKKYIGRFTERETATLEEVKNLAGIVREALQSHCPELSINDMECATFSQVFIT